MDFILIFNFYDMTLNKSSIFSWLLIGLNKALLLRNSPIINDGFVCEKMKNMA
jgi:hypothetical protein